MNLALFSTFSEAWMTSRSVELDLFLPKVANSKGKESQGVLILGGPLKGSYSPDEKQLDWKYYFPWPGLLGQILSMQITFNFILSWPV